ncbi:MAG: hypothetical protein ACYTF1_21105 [Planctomycetota bacterium]
MAKMYYSLEEALGRLGCNEEQLKSFVRSGKLREFRDAGKLTYRVDEVDKLSSQTGDNVVAESDDEGLSLEDSGAISLAPEEEVSDSGIAAALSSTGSAAGLSGLDLEDSGSSEVAEMGESDAAGVLNLEDTGQGSDEFILADSGSGEAVGEVGLEDSGTAESEAEFGLEDSGSGSDTGEVSLEDSGSGSGTGADILSLDEVDKDVAEGMKKDDTVITNIGISVFDDDDLEIAADPMAKTLLTGADEHLGLDGSGAGSGLLDLTRESDDTSLGAELLEGIDMSGGDTSEGAPELVEPAGVEPAEEPELVGSDEDVEVAPAASAVSLPVRAAGVPAAESAAFTGLLIAATVVLALAGALSVATGMNVWPGYLDVLADNFLYFIVGTIVGGGLFTLIGWFVGRSSTGPRPVKKAKERKVKSKKGKKGKVKADSAG